MEEPRERISDIATVVDRIDGTATGKRLECEFTKIESGPIDFDGIFPKDTTRHS